VVFASAAFGSAQAPRGKADAGGFPAPTPELERGRAVYVRVRVISVTALI